MSLNISQKKSKSTKNTIAPKRKNSLEGVSDRVNVYQEGKPAVRNAGNLENREQTIPNKASNTHITNVYSEAESTKPTTSAPTNRQSDSQETKDVQIPINRYL